MPMPLARVFLDHAAQVRAVAEELRAAGLPRQADALLLELRTAAIVG
jgi:hypothetical protein